MAKKTTPQPVTGSFDELDNCHVALRTMHQAMHVADLVESELGNIVQYRTVAGSVSGFGLVKKDEYAIAIATGSDRAMFADHIHEDAVEHLIVLTGVLLVTLRNGLTEAEDETVRVVAGEDIKIERCSVHNVKWEQPGDVLAVTIPADMGFPDGR